jgi:arsenate reductase-like glutaredoxin family protein
VVFTAPKRCPHCQEQKPALEWLSDEGYPVYLVDVEQPDTEEIEATLGGRGVPFSKMYARGQLLTEKLGKLEAEDLRAFFRKGAELAAQMGSHRPSTPPLPARPHEATPTLAGHGETSIVQPPAPRGGYRSLRGILSGFGRE